MSSQLRGHAESRQQRWPTAWEMPSLCSLLFNDTFSTCGTQWLGPWKFSWTKDWFTVIVLKSAREFYLFNMFLFVGPRTLRIAGGEAKHTTWIWRNKVATAFIDYAAGVLLEHRNGCWIRWPTCHPMNLAPLAHLLGCYQKVANSRELRGCQLLHGSLPLGSEPSWQPPSWACHWIVSSQDSLSESSSLQNMGIQTLALPLYQRDPSYAQTVPFVLNSFIKKRYFISHLISLLVWGGIVILTQPKNAKLFNLI